MAKLDAKQRDDLPKKDFGEPGKKAYPIPDKGHAIAAKADATRAVDSGKMSKSTEAKIDSKADAKLDDKPSRGKAAHDKYRGDHAMPKGC